MPGTMPPIRVRRASGWQYVVGLGPAVVAPVAVLVSVRAGPGEIMGTLTFLLTLVAVVGTLTLRGQRAHRARLLRGAPTGSLYATPAVPFEVVDTDSAVRPRPTSAFNGVLVIGRAGITFAESSRAPIEVSLPWAEMDSVEMVPDGPARAILRVRTATRQLHSWRMAGANALAATLRALPHEWD